MQLKMPKQKDAVPFHKRLQSAFMKSLGLAPETDFQGLEYGKHELWDSVAHMRLVSEIETAFDVMLENDDVIAMSSYLAGVRILEKHGVSCDA